jgi:DNA-binding PucR family transcriptional regulator
MSAAAIFDATPGPSVNYERQTPPHQHSRRWMARFADATMFSVLRDPEEARVVVDRVLGRLIDYDATHSGEMVRTLDTFLRCERSLLQTATELGIHRQCRRTAP